MPYLPTPLSPPRADRCAAHSPRRPAASTLTRAAAILGLCLAWLVAGGCASTPPATTPAEHAGLTYTMEIWDTPRPLRWHHLAIDLADPTLQVTTAVNPDPDGDGPAESTLRDPAVMVQEAGLLAAINANPFGPITPPNTQPNYRWYDGQPVEILGLAARDQEILSPPMDQYWAAWADSAGSFHVGQPTPKDANPVAAGVAGFHWMVQGGEVISVSGGDMHPRTAVGIDESGRWLHFVVVDGRQPGISEGVTVEELALYMREIGCYEAVNLDGGGSSVLLMRDAEGRPQVMNTPSTVAMGVHLMRPAPILLGVRRVPAP